MLENLTICLRLTVRSYQADKQRYVQQRRVNSKDVDSMSIQYFLLCCACPIISKKSVASFSVAYYEVSCIIFHERCILQKHRSPPSRLHPNDATPSVFETKFCENLFDLTNIVCCYETKNVYGIYRNSHDVI